VAVATVQENVDPVGSCLGPRGIRLQSIINELNGEKIDVIQWHADPGVFIANALSPAQVSSIKTDEERNIATVVVPDKQLSLAIGKEGQNARLAAKLTGWRIDIKSVSAIEAEKTVIPEPETTTKVISPKIKERKPREAEPAEDIGAEEPVEIPSISEAPSEKPEKKQIRFAEDILAKALKAKIPDKIKSEIKGKRKGKVIKYKKQDEHLIDDESEE
jgi:N utilization substance protein A